MEDYPTCIYCDEPVGLAVKTSDTEVQYFCLCGRNVVVKLGDERLL